MEGGVYQAAFPAGVVPSVADGHHVIKPGFPNREAGEDVFDGQF
jgi:hypothetical protein